MTKSIVLHSVIGVVLMASLTDCGNSVQNEIVQENDTIPLTKHWEIPIPHQEVPQGLVSLYAKDCGMCHQEIYNEWQQSVHAVAFQDLQFQAEWKKDNVIVCLNCHTPLQDQQEFIVTGLLNGDYKTPVKTPNPHFDKALQMESITCATCHVRDGNVIGTMGITNAPHKTTRDVEFLSEQICLGCHNVVSELSLALVCTFETGDEWQNNWAFEAGKNCIFCHMPAIERSIVAGFPTRKSHSHYFPGSGIPKFYDMKSNRLDGLEITEDKIKDTYSVGEKINYSLILKNSYAGHNVPTGDPERFILITFKVSDSDGKILKQEEHRIGEKWQWHPVAKKLSDNNLKPLEERAFDFSYRLPDKNGLSLIIEVTRHRITKENAEFMGILDKYPLSVSVFKKSYPIHLEYN